jgi:hypothetical protein
MRRFAIPGIQGPTEAKKSDVRRKASPDGGLFFTILGPVDDGKTPVFKLSLTHQDSKNVYCTLLNEKEGRFIFKEYVGNGKVNYNLKLSHRDWSRYMTPDGKPKSPPIGTHKLEVCVDGKFINDFWVTINHTQKYIDMRCDVAKEALCNKCGCSHIWDDIFISWDDMLVGSACETSWDDLI